MARKKAGSETGAKPLPVCKAILLCQQAIIDARTGMPSLIGIFNGLLLKKFPGRTLRCTTYLQLEDGIDDYDITVEVHDLREDLILARTTGNKIVFSRKRMKLNLFIDVPPLNIMHQGFYDLVVFADGREVDRQQFKTILFPNRRGKKNDATDPDESQD
jgi:hypothetical protein